MIFLGFHKFLNTKAGLVVSDMSFFFFFSIAKDVHGFCLFNGEIQTSAYVHMHLYHLLTGCLIFWLCILAYSVT